MEAQEYLARIIAHLDQRPAESKRVWRFGDDPSRNGEQAWRAAALIRQAYDELSAADYRCVCVGLASRLSEEQLARYLAFGGVVIPPEHYGDLPHSWSTFREISAVAKKSYALVQSDACLRRAFKCGAICPGSGKQDVDHVDNILRAEQEIADPKALRHIGDRRQSVTLYERDLLMGRLGEGELLKVRAEGARDGGPWCFRKFITRE